ncbi:nuclear pore complex protein Nup54 [Echinococcus multilocularis]|uniref:Nuclear pore complex protein Nup54 n=1 Tax=Echinococcus multilocularis TaxID=6211 RepID=A0A068YDB8_ECHMU|nr:nuclear pore complex protein Nup54 [Echinococcus multilocularis]
MHLAREIQSNLISSGSQISHTSVYLPLFMFGNVSKPLFGTQQPAAFGATTQSGFSFGTSTTPNAFGFGAKTTTSSAFSLGPTNIFGGLGTATSNASPFSFSAATKPGSLFGNARGSAPTNTKPGSLFSFSSPQGSQATSGLQPGSGLLSQSTTVQQQQQQRTQQSVDAFYASLSQPMLFGDERDNIIARLNQLQAMLGTGIGYSALGTVTYTPDNPFSRFRGVAYNVMPTSSEADGLVCMELTKAFADVLPLKQGIQDYIFRLLGGHVNYQLTIEEIRPSARSENNTEVVIKVVERLVSGATHIVPASDLANFLCGPTIKPQLESQLCVCRLMPELAPSASQINAYLEIPPAGFDKRVWQQAREDNPAPNRLIPVPVIGFADLKRRRDGQLLFGDQQHKAVKHLLSAVSVLQAQQISTSQKIAQIKSKQIELNHRVLKLLAKQTVARRAGFAISAEEEALRCALDHIWSEITAPRGLRARIQQMLPSVRTKATGGGVSKRQNATVADVPEDSEGFAATTTAWWQHPEIVDDLREYLSQRTTGIKEMRRLLAELNTVVRILTEKKTKTSTVLGPTGYPGLGVKVEPTL